MRSDVFGKAALLYRNTAVKSTLLSTSKAWCDQKKRLNEAQDLQKSNMLTFLFTRLLHANPEEVQQKPLQHIWSLQKEHLDV